PLGRAAHSSSSRHSLCSLFSVSSLLSMSIGSLVHSFFERSPQLHLKNGHRQIADAFVNELVRLLVKQGFGGGVLRDRLDSGPCVARDAKRPLRPAQNAQRLVIASPEKHIRFLTRPKRWSALDARIEIAEGSTKHAYGHNCRKRTLRLRDDRKSRIRPNLAVLPKA